MKKTHILYSFLSNKFSDHYGLYGVCGVENGSFGRKDNI